MVRNFHIRLALIGAAFAGCAAFAAPQDGARHVEFTLPDAPDPQQPRPGRLQQIVELLQPIAMEEAVEAGGEAVPYSRQVGYDSEFYLIGAVGETAGVYYVAPFLGPYPARGIDPWDMARMEGSRVSFDACRFEIHPENLPGARRFAQSGRYTGLWPDPTTCAPRTDAGDNAVPEEVSMLADGYEIYDAIEGDGEMRAALVVHPSRSTSRFDPDAALDHYLDGREVAWSMALPIASWNAAVAELADGSRIFLANPSRENARACIFEGLDWETFRGFESGEDHPLRTFCNEAIAAHQQDYVDYLNSGPPPRIQAMPLPGSR